ncbi:MAG TPA: cupin domain-containing protein [Candidatus Limnocylindria bacterium]|nr:cupin domain-containing protein [Candidatus Limnocylindria bacterium]
MTGIGSASAYGLAEGEGERHWFVGALMVRKAGRTETGGAFDLLDQTMPAHYSVPRHIHRQEDEAWFVLDGDITFQCGDRQLHVERGGWIFAPRNVPHTFKVGNAGARALTLTSPSGFAEFVAEMGEPATELIIPRAAPVDEQLLAQVATRYGVEIVGPPL